MPNYVYNCLSFNSDNTKDISNLIEAIKGENTVLDFSKIIPIPKKEMENQEKEQSWKKYNWGCKWNAMDIEFDDYTYYFLTPWNPPIPVIKALSKQYPNINILLEYCEETGSDSGFVEFHNGKLIASNYISGKENNEYYEKFWGLDD